MKSFEIDNNGNCQEIKHRDVFSVPEKRGSMWHVCAWCYPGLTVLNDYPWLDRETISHGMCEFHSWLILFQSSLDYAYSTRQILPGPAMVQLSSN